MKDMQEEYWREKRYKESLNLCKNGIHAWKSMGQQYPEGAIAYICLTCQEISCDDDYTRGKT